MKSVSNKTKNKKYDLETGVVEEIKLLKDEKGFLKAGKPVFNRLFGRDSLIAAWQLLDYDPSVARATLEILSELQGTKIDKKREEEPGKIIHETDLELDEHPSIKGFPFPYYGSVDSTPLYLIVFGFYHRKTHDEKLLQEHWTNILSALDWMEKYGDSDGDLFLEYTQHNENALVNQCWKDSDEYKIEMPIAIVEAQGYEYLALKESSRLSRTMDDPILAKKLEERAAKLKEAFNKKFWMKDKKFFALALDGKKRQQKSITSNVGHLLFTGIIDERKLDLVVRRLFKKDLFTPCGIRTHSSFEPDFHPESYHLGAVWPHDNWIIAQGLKALGYRYEYLSLKKAIMRAHEEIGFLPEFYRVKENRAELKSEKPEYPSMPCYPQAWSSGALLNFLEEK
jgi:glycogen debranching enzyme